MKQEIVNIYENNNFIIAKSNFNNDYIVSDRENSFYKINEEKYKELFSDEKFIRKKVIKDSFFLMLSMLLFICFVIVYYLYKVNYTLIDSNFIIATVIVLVNIPIHEFGHIAMLKLFNKSSKVKIGFKIMFIYPVSSILC